MEELSNREIQKRRMLSYFIEATLQIMEEEGSQNISIRKVGKKAGYNSATIYNYFQDVNQLILLASVKHLQCTSFTISRYVKENQSPLQNFLGIWDFLCEVSLERPHTFYNLFFSAYGSRLDSLTEQYYGIFPEEQYPPSPLLFSELTGQNMLERNRKTMLPLEEAGYISSGNCILANEIIVSCFRDILWQKCADKNVHSRELKEKMNAIIRFVICRDV